MTNTTSDPSSLSVDHQHDGQSESRWCDTLTETLIEHPTKGTIDG